ncbi:MAG TPA: hypothetical protein VNF46_00650 [Gammaproteobacteria bacterium]|nr:hypothetical protein [Gammaproteobacteria bacterium]
MLKLEPEWVNAHAPEHAEFRQPQLPDNCIDVYDKDRLRIKWAQEIPENSH